MLHKWIIDYWGWIIFDTLLLYMNHDHVLYVVYKQASA